jgi:short-subunit dehydrogenase
MGWSPPAPGFMWLDADEVVAEALRDLRRGVVVCVPSRRYRALVTATRFAPRSVLAKVGARR